MGEISSQPYLLEKLGLFWAPRVTASSSLATSASMNWPGLSWECLAFPLSGSLLCPCARMCWAKWLHHVRLRATPWTVARQLPLSTEFSRQEYCSGLPFHSPGDLPNPGIKPASRISPALADRFFIARATWGEGQQNPAPGEEGPRYTPWNHPAWPSIWWLHSPTQLTLISSDAQGRNLRQAGPQVRQEGQTGQPCGHTCF